VKENGMVDSNVQQIMGSTAYDSNGNKIGTVGQVYLDDVTGQPDWATVNTGFFGTSESFVPLASSSFDGDKLTVAYSKDKVKDAPNVSLDGGHLSQDEERRLYEYYGLGYDTTTDYDTTTTVHDTTATGTTAGTTTNVDTTVGHDTSGPTTDDAMTRSEERVQVGTASEEAGRARLRKYVETEQVSETVPVTKERAVVQSEPITDGNVGNATSGPAISEEEHEVVLREETPVVQKTVEPVERVRLGTEQVTEQETVTEEVRRERIEADGDVNGGTTGTTGTVR
jgi:stress response protein YsnF